METSAHASVVWRCVCSVSTVNLCSQLAPVHKAELQQLPSGPQVHPHDPHEQPLSRSDISIGCCF